MTNGTSWSIRQWSAAARVAAAAPSSGLKPTGLRPFAVFGAAGLMAAWSFLAAPVSAGQSDKPKERIVKQEVTGEVVARTGRTLSLETSKAGNASEEMLLPVDPAVVRLDRVVSLADLKPGDRVRVEYRQRFQEIADGEFRLMWTEATKISLLSRAMSGQRQVLQAAPDDGGGS